MNVYFHFGQMINKTPYYARLVLVLPIGGLPNLATSRDVYYQCADMRVDSFGKLTANIELLS